MADAYTVVCAKQQAFLKTTMKITNEMLQSAIAKAIELGVLPRRGHPEDIATNAEIMHEVLLAALEQASKERDAPEPGPSYRKQQG